MGEASDRARGLAPHRCIACGALVVDRCPLCPQRRTLSARARADRARHGVQPSPAKPLPASTVQRLEELRQRIGYRRAAALLHVSSSCLFSLYLGMATTAPISTRVIRLINLHHGAEK